MNRKKWDRMQRAQYRSAQRSKDLMWKKLSSDNSSPLTGYKGEADADAGFYYTPYMPVFGMSVKHSDMGIIANCTA